MVEDRVLGPTLLKNPVRKLVEPRNRVLKRIKKYIGDGMSVLDAGSGPGYYTEELLKAVGMSGTVAAVDPNPKSISELKKLNYGNLTAVVGSATDLKFEDNSFDFVFSNLLLCCVYNYKKALEEMIRVLKPNATSYISVSRSFINVKPGINADEWKEILSKFKVLETGEGITDRWAVVQKI
ncbi:MAG: class I SAM-dependent methyltransferase [Thaumarchaeota archaeon]|nr:class I SAM-dependent methyltransferase [Nitrososphaerota archaeon]MDG6927116.1 class I SAM-dependent methyltransferase [Nitrososphaerota archaeon]